MKYRIDHIPDTEKVISHFEDLMLLAHIFDNETDLPEGVSADKVLRYLIYMYSPGTPVRNELTDLEKRKQYCLLKINVLNSEEEDVVDGYGEMCAMKDAWIIERFMAFTGLQKSVDYGLLFTLEERSAKIQKYLLTAGIDKATDDKNLMDGLDRVITKLKETLDRITEGETSIALQREIMFSIQKKRLGIAPEDSSREFREKGILYTDIVP